MLRTFLRMPPKRWQSIGFGLCIDGCPPHRRTLRTPAKALWELCGSASRYFPTEQFLVAPYTEDLVSWPPEGTVASPIEGLLSGADRTMVCEWETSILRDESERRSHFTLASRVQPYLEPSLVKRPEVYSDFLRRLEAAGMLTWRVGGPSLLGTFFVRKKSGRLRLILDTRDVNSFFLLPPSTHLPSSAAFAAVETDGTKPLHFAGGDICDFFYHLSAPPGMEQWFSLPGLRGSFVPWARIPQGRIGPKEWAVPLLKVLPM